MFILCSVAPPRRVPAACACRRRPALQAARGVMPAMCSTAAHLLQAHTLLQTTTKPQLPRTSPREH